MTTLTAAEIKEIAKTLQVKNWWTKKKADLVTEIVALKGWEKETPEVIDYLLKGGEIKNLPESPLPAPKHNREDQAYQVTEKPAKKTRRKPTKKAKTEKAPKKDKSTLPEGWVTLAALCTELDVEPRIARRRLRKAELVKDEKYGWAWELPATEVKNIILGK